MSASTNGSSFFWQKRSAQTSPFGSAIESSQPASIFDSSTPFCASSQPPFGSTTTPAFTFGSFGQSSSAFGTSSPFGSTTSAFGGGQSSALGSQTPTQVASYSGQFVKLESISAMSVYEDKSHEELSWEDYQLGDKGGPLASAPQSTGMAGFKSSTTKTNPSPVFGQSSANPFSRKTPNAFSPPSTFTSGFGTSAPAFSSSAFGSSTSAAAPSIFGSSTSPFGSTSPTFGQSSANPFSSITHNSNNPFAPKNSTFTFNIGTTTPSFSSSPYGSSTSAATTSIFGSSPSPFGANSSSSPLFGSSIFGNTQSSPLFSSSTPTNPQSGSAFGQNTSPFGQTGAFIPPSLFGPTSGHVGSILSSSASLTSNALKGSGQTAPSMSTPFQTAQPAQSSGTFAFSNFGPTQPGTQTLTQAFANTGIVQSEFGGQRGGSRVASYSATFVEDTPSIVQIEKLESISAIPLYKDKSHEELRLEDYQLDSSTSPNAQSGSVFGQNTFPFGQTAGFRPSSFFGSPSSRLVGSIFSSMESLTSNAPSPSLAILTGTVVVTVVVTRWITLRRCGRV